MAHRPILANSCAMAATSREAAFRIPAPVVCERTTVLVALDKPAVPVVWSCRPELSDRLGVFVAGGVGAEPAVVSDVDGKPFDAHEVLRGVDLVVLVASEDDSAGRAAVLGYIAADAGATVAGIVLAGTGKPPRTVLTELRRYCHLVLVSSGPGDLSEVLLALRA